jgi:CobQ-like glutamine amidotransferase family enzyme
MPSLPLTITIGWLYGHEMNIYGDRGNVLALAKRAEWRGLAARVVTVGVGDELDTDALDLYFWGGGQDREQITVSRDLAGAKGAALAQALENGAPALAVCGGYQLLGHFYRPHEGDALPGIGVLDVTSEAGHERFIGNVVVDSPEFGALVGFENHSACTWLGAGVSALGRVRVGHGNNGADGSEGARYKHIVGCYMHGALLPKNPALADWLLARAVERRHGAQALAQLDDTLELRAHDTVVERALALRR